MKKSRVDSSPVPCTEKSQLELTLAHDKILNKNITKLNTTISRVVRFLDKDKRVEFDTAQIAWEHFAHAWANFESNQSYGGTIRPMLYSIAKSKLIKQRIYQLEHMAVIEHNPLR